MKSLLRCARGAFTCATLLAGVLVPVHSALAVDWIGKGDLTRPFRDPLNWRVWSDSAKAYVNLLPAPGDMIYFTAGAPELHIGDDDAALASQVKTFYLQSNCKVYWDVTTNSYLAATIAGGRDGMFYKMKGSSLTLVPPYVEGNQFVLSGSYTVAEGKLYLMRYSDPNYKGNLPSAVLFVTGYCTVSNNATLVLAEKSPTVATTSNFYSLESYGLITNENAGVRHVFSFRSDATVSTPGNPSRVYGPVGGNIEYDGYGCCEFYHTNNTFVVYNPMTSGSQPFACETSVMSFGKADGTPSSLGTQNNLKYTWSGAVTRYLGTGETTDKTFNYMLHASYAGWAHNYPPGLDGGPYGGLQYRGSFTSTYGNDRPATHMTLLFTGSNAVPCELWSNFGYKWKDNVHFTPAVIKRGTGTWLFRDGTGELGTQQSKVSTYGGLTGSIMIEEGVLQTESMSDVGQHSALGSSEYLYGEYVGVHADAVAQGWAISFGTDDADGTPLTEGTLESVSTNFAFASDRKMVLRGNGRLKSSGEGAFCMAYVKARTAGGKTLTLDGSNTLDNVIQEISDGRDDATVSVVKEGSGKWILRGNQTFSGDLTVKAGLLEVQAPTNHYTWYKFSDMADSSTIGQLGEIALYDADGTQQNAGLKLGTVFSWGADGKVHWIRNEWTQIQPGECGPGRTGKCTFYSGGNAMARLCDGKADNGCMYQGMDYTVRYKYYTHNPLVMRLTNGAPAIVSYDVFRGNNTARRTGGFRMDASRDGLLWKKLDDRDVVSTTNDVSTWCSDGAAFVAGEKRPYSAGKGYPLADGSADTVSSLEKVGYVSVAKGATLKTDYENVGTISKLRFPTAGGGTISGFKFAETGTIDIEGEVQKGKELKIPYELGDGETAANVTGWGFTINGEASTKFDLVAGPHGCTLKPHGLLLLVR